MSLVIENWDVALKNINRYCAIGSKINKNGRKLVKVTVFLYITHIPPFGLVYPHVVCNAIDIGETASSTYLPMTSFESKVSELATTPFT